MTCACSHDRRMHVDGRHCLADDGHPEYGGPDPCPCLEYVAEDVEDDGPDDAPVPLGCACGYCPSFEG